MRVLSLEMLENSGRTSGDLELRSPSTPFTGLVITRSTLHLHGVGCNSFLGDSLVLRIQALPVETVCEYHLVAREGFKELC